MGSPTLFAGKYTKLLTQKGILNSDGSVNQFDGFKNYITYSLFEQGTTTGWSLFNTTLTAGLPTGTVGAGAASLTLNTTTTNPLMGSYSMQLASAAAWSAGEGVISSAFTMDRADLGDSITVDFAYEVVSGSANANFSGVQGSQTLGVYLYDVTAAAWVQPSNFLSITQTSGSAFLSGSFKCSNTAGQQYRLAILALQASTGALTMNFDQFFVGPAIENINASYYCSANFAASTLIPINFDTKLIDSHSAVTTSPTAWKFTAPVPGVYLVGTYVYGGNPGTSVAFNIYKNGSNYKTMTWQQSGSNTSGIMMLRLNANDYIDMRPDSVRTITGGTLSNVNVSYLEILWVGN